MELIVSMSDVRCEENRLIIEVTPDLMKKLTCKNRILSEFKPGETFSDCDGVKYIVCEHFDNGTTGIVTKDILDLEIEFGKDNNWKNSKRREYLNSEYLDKLSRKFGKSNIIRHDVDLLSMDGYNDYGVSSDMVSDMTFERYRKYHRYIGDCDNSYFLATPDSTPSGYGASVVRYVGGGGGVCCGDCDWCDGVRPFCIIKSSIFVSKNV